MITATIRILGKETKATGATVADALAALKHDGAARFVSWLTVKNAKEEQEIVLSPMFTMRLFSINPAIREVAIRNIADRFHVA